MPVTRLHAPGPDVAITTPTLPVALALLLGYQSIDWHQLMAGSTVAVIPVIAVFLIFQKQIISGITAGAFKQ